MTTITKDNERKQHKNNNFQGQLNCLNKEKRFELLKSLTERYWYLTLTENQRNTINSCEDNKKSRHLLSSPLYTCSNSSRHGFPLNSETSIDSVTDQFDYNDYHSTFQRLRHKLRSKSVDISGRKNSGASNEQNNKTIERIALQKYIELANDFYENGILKDIKYLNSLGEECRMNVQRQQQTTKEQIILKESEDKELIIGQSEKSAASHQNRKPTFFEKYSPIFTKDLNAELAGLSLEKRCLLKDVNTDRNSKKFNTEKKTNKSKIKGIMLEKAEENHELDDEDEDTQSSIVISVHLKPHGSSADETKSKHRNAEQRRRRKGKRQSKT